MANHQQKFTAGQLFSNLSRWQRFIEEEERSGAFVPEVLKDAVRSGAFDVRHPSFTNLEADHVVFRGRVFSSKKDLLDKTFENSKSIKENYDLVWAEILALIECKAVREVSEEEAYSQHSVISPILWVSQQKPDLTMKHRLIHHDRLNYTYSKPKFRLANISSELERIADFDGLFKADLEKCFYGGDFSSVYVDFVGCRSFSLRFHGLSIP